MKKKIKNNRKSITIFALLLTFVGAKQSLAQIYESSNNETTFFSEAPLENIEAKTQKVYCELNLQTGEVKSKLLIESFEFGKAIMQQHFNEQYMESHKYPNATLEGQIAEIDNLKNKVSGNYTVTGDLTLHGVTKPQKFQVKIFFQGDTAMGNSTFNVKTADYKIKIPKSLPAIASRPP